jgi:hypothetical protein
MADTFDTEPPRLAASVGSPASDDAEERIGEIVRAVSQAGPLRRRGVLIEAAGAVCGDLADYAEGEARDLDVLFGLRARMGVALREALRIAPEERRRTIVIAARALSGAAVFHHLDGRPSDAFSRALIDASRAVCGALANRPH